MRTVWFKPLKNAVRTQSWRIDVNLDESESLLRAAMEEKETQTLQKNILDILMRMPNSLKKQKPSYAWVDCMYGIFVKRM